MSAHFCQVEEKRHRVQSMFSCFLFLPCLPPLPTPPSSCHESPGEHTHIHTQTHSKNEWPCILHESSTSEGLAAFYILQLTAEMMRWKPGAALKGCRLSFFFTAAAEQNRQEAGNTGLKDVVCCSLKHRYVINQMIRDPGSYSCAGICSVIR